MKTMTCEQCRKKIQKEEQDKFLKSQYEIVKNFISSICCYTTTAALMVMVKRGRSPEYIRKFFDDLVFIYSTPNLFNKKIDMVTEMKYLEKNYGIDFNRIEVHMEDEKEFCKGAIKK